MPDRQKRMPVRLLTLALSEAEAASDCCFLEMNQQSVAAAAAVAVAAVAVADVGGALVGVALVVVVLAYWCWHMRRRC